MKVNPKNIIKEGLLLEQAAYDPVTSSDVTNVLWDPCTNPQFMLGDGQGNYVGCSWAGQIDISSYGAPPFWDWPVPWGGACSNTSNEVCLAYDPAHGFITSDANSTLGSTACNSGCAWGTTLGGTSGMFFEGWECNGTNGICSTVDTGVGTYDTTLICDSNCSGTVTQTIGCCNPYTASPLMLPTNVGCADINNPGDPAFALCTYTDCCTFNTGCLDNREYSSGNAMVPAGNAWLMGTVGVPGGVSATFDNALQLYYDNTTIPYTIGTGPSFGFPTSSLLLSAFQGCNYGVMGGPSSGVWGCLDPTATNYCPTCEADCGTQAVNVPTLMTGDPYFTFLTPHGQDWCCTYTEGCMDGGPANNCGGTVPGTGCIPLWRPIGFQGEACTYDQYATVHIEGDCQYGTCAGCTNPLSLLYCATCTSDNGSCTFTAGCMDPAANNTNLNAVADCDGNLVIDGAEYAAWNGNAYSLWPSFLTTAGGTISSTTMVTTGCGDPNDDCTYTINGCTDANAFNYDGTANSDDGSCTYEACGNPGATNYFYLPATSVQYTPPLAYTGVDCDGTSPFAPGTDEGCCTMPLYGCTDPAASNYNSTSGAIPCTAGNGGPCIEDASGTMQTGSNCCCCLVTGCADNTTTWNAACNHPTAGADNYDQWACDPNPASCEYNGCTDPSAYNYCPTANTDDGSCVFEGCNDPAGNNNTGGDGCVGDGGLIGVNNNGSVPNGCCSYTYGCTDPVAINYNANVDYVCNATSNNSTFTTVYGNSGPNTAFPVYITPTDGGATDNYCCTYIPGCTDSVAVNYDPTATLDDGSCTYTFGCKEQDDGETINQGPHNYTNYTPAAIYPCNNTMGNPETFGIPTSAYGTLPTDGLYDSTDDNDCCYIEGCLDQNAIDFIPWGTVNGICTFPSYGCAVQFNANGDAYDNYILGNAGCYDTIVDAGPWYWQWTINGTPTNGPGIPDPIDESCCTYTAPNIISFGCVGQYSIGDDLNVPPAGGWGACEQIIAPLVNQYQAAELLYGLTNAPTAPLTWEGAYLFQGPDTDILAINAACNASCQPSGQHDCEDLPVIGCSFCQPDSLGDLCSTAVDDMTAIFWGWDPLASSAGPYLAFNTLDDCTNSPDCGLERHGCMNPNYCEFWTQSIKISDNPILYENGTNGNITYPAGVPGHMTIGLLSVDSSNGGCLTLMTPGCTNPQSGDYNPGAIENCPNPYIDAGGTPSPNTDDLAANSNGPNRWVFDIPIWDNGGLYVNWPQPTLVTNPAAQGSSSPLWGSEGDWSCSFVCEDSFSMLGDPLAVMQNGGACCVCECPNNGVPCSQNCTLEDDPLNYDGSWIYHNPDDLQTWTGCLACDNSTVCGGVPGQVCIDDGTDTFSGEFDSKRASFGWPMAGTASSTNSPYVPACNYDANAVPQIPDEDNCDYECKGCSDPTALNGPPNPVGCDSADPFQPSGVVQAPATYNAPLVAEDDCCCYIDGCTDDTIGDNPGKNSSSGQYDLCADGTICNTSGCCGAGNGYVMVNFDPEACMDDGSCTSDRGFNCDEGGGSTGLCLPHITAGLGTFTTLNGCVASGCGSDRWLCNEGKGMNNNTGVVSIGPGETGTYLSADSETTGISTGIETGVGIDKEFDRETTSQTKLTEQMAGGNFSQGAEAQLDMEKEQAIAVSDPSKLLDCCIPDPAGPHLSKADCVQTSICYDCATFDDPRWHCEAGAGTYDPVLNQSGSLCTLTTLGDCITNSWTCWTNQMACVRSGCEHDHETWTCPWDPRNIPSDDQSVTLGEQNWYGTSFRKPLNEWSVVNDIYPDCVQAGYMGWNSEQECLDNSPCTTSTGGTCFIGSCKIKMFDGTEKRIDQVIEGDIVLNDKGTSSTVAVAQRHEDFHDKIYGFNGEDPFVTAEHPLLVEGDKWKSIDPTWFPEEFSHDIERFQLEVGDKLIVGEDKEVKVVTSIDEHKLEGAVYSLELDVVHTYYVNGYVAHNAFFRDERPLSEVEIGGGGVEVIGNPWPINPQDGCWCYDDPATYSQTCCYKYGPSGPTPPSPPTGGGGTMCCKSYNNIPVGGWANIGCPSSTSTAANPGGYLACCYPVSQGCPAGSLPDNGCKTQSWGGTNPYPNGAFYWGTAAYCDTCCGGGGPVVWPGLGGGPGSVPPEGAPPQPGSGGGDGKGDLKTQPKPEHAKKMTQWSKAVSDNAGERVTFDTYGVDTNPLFNSPSKTKYGYNIISGDITRIDGDTKTIIGNFIDKSVELEPVKEPVKEPTEKPVSQPIKTAQPETPETKELREQVVRMKKLMGL